MVFTCANVDFINFIHFGEVSWTHHALSPDSLTFFVVSYIAGASDIIDTSFQSSLLAHVLDSLGVSRRFSGHFVQIFGYTKVFKKGQFSSLYSPARCSFPNLLFSFDSQFLVHDVDHRFLHLFFTVPICGYRTNHASSDSLWWKPTGSLRQLPEAEAHAMQGVSFHG